MEKAESRLPRVYVETNQEFVYENTVFAFRKSADGSNILNIVEHLIPEFTVELLKS